MPSSRLDSHRNSVQNGMVDRFTAFMATIFEQNLSFYVSATVCAGQYHSEIDESRGLLPPGPPALSSVASLQGPGPQVNKKAM